MRAKQVRAGKSTPFFAAIINPFFFAIILHISLWACFGLYWWFHAGSLYQLVDSGPVGSFRHMRANQVRAGKRRYSVVLLSTCLYTLY